MATQNIFLSAEDRANIKRYTGRDLSEVGLRPVDIYSAIGNDFPGYQATRGAAEAVARLIAAAELARRVNKADGKGNIYDEI
jgi:hypothetical protein